jgi:hypothetical protein
MGADIGGLQALAAQLRALPEELARATRPVVMRGAVNIKNDWRANAAVSAGAHGRLYPLSIGFDEPTDGGGYVEVVIGPNKAGRQGALGNLLEFGSVHNAPHNDGGRALEAEDPRFVAAVEAAVDAALLR